MKLSDELKHCLYDKKCSNCRHYEADTKATCKGLLEKAYERIKGYEDMFPCKVGDIVYTAGHGVGRVLEWKIVSCEIYEEEVVFIDDSETEWRASDFGKRIFLTREQAEAELKKNEEVEE